MAWIFRPDQRANPYMYTSTMAKSLQWTELIVILPQGGHYREVQLQLNIELLFALFALHVIIEPYPESSSMASASSVWLATGLVCRRRVIYAANMSAFTFSSLSNGEN